MHFNREIIFDRIWGRLRRILWRYGSHRPHDLANFFIFCFIYPAFNTCRPTRYMHNILNKLPNILILGFFDKSGTL